MNKKDAFESERLIYRGISEQDADCLVKWRSNPDFYKYFRKPIPITKESHIEWYEKTYLNDFSRFDFIIIDKKSNEKIGCVSVSKINNENKSFEISYLIGETAFHRRGFASESIIAMLNRMFNTGFSAAHAEIHIDNIASIKTIEKIGFTFFSKLDDFAIYAKSIGIQ